MVYVSALLNIHNIHYMGTHLWTPEYPSYKNVLDILFQNHMELPTSFPFTATNNLHSSGMALYETLGCIQKSIYEARY